MIYTNNNGPYEWSVQIKSYFEDKVAAPNLFDQVIGAYKVNGKQVELCRTTHSKTHSDLVRCSKIPLSTDVCFIDDVYHPGMASDNVYYINIKAYEHDLPFATIVDRFIASGFLTDCDPTSMKEYILTFMKRYNHTYVEKESKEMAVDTTLSKKILQHLQVFFNKRNKIAKQLSGNKTKTLKDKRMKNKTLKRQNNNET